MHRSHDAARLSQAHRARPRTRARFQPIKIQPPSEEETIAVLIGIKERYERFHGVSYHDEAIRAAVYQSNRYITDRFLPDKAIDVIDEAGAWVKLRKRTSYRALREVEKEINKAVEGMKAALSRKDFDEAVTWHDKEVTLREKADRLRGEADREAATVLDVDRQDVEEVISKWTGIPISRVAEEEMERLLRMEEHLHQRVVGQQAAISALARAIRRSRAGLKNAQRPVGSFVFLGPTGVGKTELAKSLAGFLFGNERSMVRFDMSEYMEKHAVAKMIGSPPGYVGHEEGGLLTERIKRQPYSVVLLDEIEKAHPDVLNILLQVLDDGQITDAYGDTVDFKNTIIVMTSNIGSAALFNKGQLGFPTGDAREQDVKSKRDTVMQQVKRTLTPEFINRIDEIIVFDPLTEDELVQIARLMVGQLNASLVEKGIQLVPDDSVYGWLVRETCGDRSFGARPLRRAIQRHFEDAISEQIIAGKIQGSGEIAVQVGEDGKLRFRNSLANV
ncbi:MAG: ATP-dependent Clp protease ATP-binding subunit [Acidobacteria bacterium]|nr:ATP-dependent Clp protease ATP-binding subunit [Acidobacteriota bacterium]